MSSNCQPTIEFYVAAKYLICEKVISTIILPHVICNCIIVRTRSSRQMKNIAVHN